MLGAIFCEDDTKRRELVAKIRNQFDAVISISDINEKFIQEILRTNKTALIQCRSHRQIPHELLHMLQPVVIVGRKRAVVSDDFNVFSVPLDRIQEVNIPFGYYAEYEQRYEHRNWIRRLLRRESKAYFHSHTEQ